MFPTPLRPCLKPGPTKDQEIPQSAETKPQSRGIQAPKSSKTRLQVANGKPRHFFLACDLSLPVRRSSYLQLICAEGAK
jgi:hypothetical protein